MVDIQSAAAEIRRGKKEERRIHRAKISWPALLHRAAIISVLNTKIMLASGGLCPLTTSGGFVP